MIRAAVLVLALTMAGCAAAPVTPKRAETLPVAVTCPASCKIDCEPDQWPQWTHDPDSPEAWKALIGEMIEEFRELVLACDAKRSSCNACLRWLENQRVTCGFDRPCGPAQ